MQTEYLLYGIRKGLPDHAEELLLVRPSNKQFEHVKELARKDGFDRFREAKFVPGEMPNFAGTVRV